VAKTISKRPFESRVNHALCYPSPEGRPDPGVFVGVVRFEGDLFQVRVQINDNDTVSVELSPKEGRS
jgi:hypothetical protein